MSLKKNLKNKISLSFFKKFLRKDIFLFFKQKKFEINEKIFLTLILIHCYVQNKFQLKSINKNYFKQLFIETNNLLDDPNNLLLFFYKSISNFCEIKINKNEIYFFYYNLNSFFEYGSVVDTNFFKKNKKPNDINDFIYANAYFKEILIFLKKILPTNFGKIHKKILYLC